MIILAADTSTEYNNVALCSDDLVLSETCIRAGRAHSERLLETVDWVLQQGGVDLGQLDCLAISIGPGSFTGLRVGVATWKGLALAAQLPLVAVPTLDAYVRAGIQYEGCVCPLLDAKMGEVFGAVFSVSQGHATKTTKDLVCSVDTILDAASGDPLFIGEGALRYAEEIRARFPSARIIGDEPPRASWVAFEAHCLVRQGAETDAAIAAPVYLRKSQAEEALDQKKEALSS